MSKEGLIIRMNSKELVDKFIPAFKDELDTFQYVIVSDHIKHRPKKMKSICTIKTLIPPARVIQHKLDKKEKKYKRAYLEYLNEPNVNVGYVKPFATGVKEEGWKIVILCSHEEDEYGYLKILGKHIEEMYGLKVYSVKKAIKELKGE